MSCRLKVQDCAARRALFERSYISQAPFSTAPVANYENVPMQATSGGALEQDADHSTAFLESASQQYCHIMQRLFQEFSVYIGQDGCTVEMKNAISPTDPHNLCCELGCQVSDLDSFSKDDIAEVVKSVGDYLKLISHVPMFWLTIQVFFWFEDVSSSTESVIFKNGEGNE